MASEEFNDKITIHISMMQDSQAFEHYYVYINGIEAGYYNKALNELHINDIMVYGTAPAKLIAAVVKKRFGTYPSIK